MNDPERLEENRAAGLLARLARHEGEAPDLPDPAVLWRKARLLEALDARKSAARPLQVAHSLSLVLASGGLAALAGSKGVSLLEWIADSAAGLLLPLTLSLFVLGAGLALAVGAAAGRNLARREGK